MRQLDIFKTSIFETALDINLNKFIKKFKAMKKESAGRVLSNAGGWQSQNFNFKDPLLKELKNHIEDAIKQVHHQLGFKKSTRLHVNNIWCNFNDYQQYNTAHSHPNSILSGVLYFQTPPKCGSIVFLNPIHLLNHLWDPHLTETYTHYNSGTWAVPAKAGMMVVFPSWLLHRVQASKSYSSRISISFNTDAH